jgi:hypothetical protein
MAGVPTGYRSAVRKPAGRRIRVWRCCGRPLGDSRSHREATALPAPAKVLVTAFVVVKCPNASAFPNTVANSMLLLSDMTSFSRKIATELSPSPYTVTNSMLLLSDMTSIPSNCDRTVSRF